MNSSSKAIRISDFGFRNLVTGGGLRVPRHALLATVLALGLGGAVDVFSQTAPTAQSLPFSVNFGTTTFTSAPAGVAVWNGLSGNTISNQVSAEGSAPTGNATLATASASTTSGGAFGYAVSGDGKLYIQTSSNASNGVNQPVIAIITTGLSGISLSYTVDVINASPKTIGVAAQYRVGTAGPWTTLTPVSGLNPFSQAGGTTGLKSTVNITLPSAADNQPVVQIRWAVWRGTETGNSSGFALDNISATAAPTVAPAAPVVSTPTLATTSGFTANWQASSGATKYFLDVSLDSGFGSFVTGFNNLDVGSGTSFAVTGLSPNTTYYYRVRAFNSAGTSANSQNQVALTASLQAPGIAVSTNSLTGFSYNGAGPSTAQSVSVTASNLTGAPGSLSVAGSANYEVSLTSDSAGFGTSALINYTNATLDATNVWIRLKANLAAGNYNSESISISGGGAANPATVSASGTVTKPTINLSTTNLGSFTGTNGIAGAPKTNTITGTNLLGDITIVATNFFEVSGDAGTTYTNNLVLTPTAGVISNAVLFRIASNAPVGSLGTNLVTLSTPETTNRTVQVIGTVVNGGITLTANGLTNALALFEGDTAQLGVTLSAPAPAGGVSVTVVNPDATELDFTTPIVVAEGATTAEVTLTAVVDNVFDANQTLSLQATATGWTSSANLSVTVQNNDPEPLSYVSIVSTNTASYTQNFDGLGTNTVANAFSATSGARTALAALLQTSSLDGWYAGKRAGNGTTALSLVASIGGDNSGGIYNLGASGNSDRALGTMSSSSTTPAFGALIKNDTTNILTGLKLSFTAEFWRSCTSTTNVLAFGFGKVDGATVTTGNFLTTTNVNSSTNLNITGPAPVATNGALDGNSAANQSSFANVLVPVNLAPGEVAFIRWQDTDEGGNDAALAIDNFSITAEANPLLAPEFDRIAGVYLTDQTVKVSNYAQYPAGVEVRYTLDGTTPTVTSTLYDDATGILVVQGNGPVTLRAVAIQSESGGSSAVGSVTYSLPKNVADLTALRASAADGATIYRVQGPMVMSGKTANRNTKFFQDSGAGIQIDDNAGVITNNYSVGDEVQGAIGKISFFAGQLQFVPHQDFGPAASSNNTLTPVSRTLTSLSDADQARLVVITGVEFQTNAVGLAFGTTRTNLPIKDPSTASSTNAFSGYFRHLFIDGDLSAATVPAGSGTVTGVVQKTTISGATNITVAPRTTADLSFSGATPLESYLSSYGLTGPSAAGTADPDGDGIDNNAEFAFGTSPVSGDSRAATLSTGTGEIKLTYLQRDSGVTYTVKSLPDLATTFDSGTTVTPTPAADQTSKPSGYTRYEASVNTGSTRGFLRVRAIAP